MPTMNIMQTLKAVQSATIKARESTGMSGIGTRVKAGKFQVINTTPSGSTVIVDPLSDWMDSASAIEVLDQIAADAAFRA